MLLAPVSLAAEERGPSAVRERVEHLVRERFYDPERGETFALPAIEGERADALDARIESELDRLGTSHTGHWRPDQIDYFELLDIFHIALADEIERLFPEEGHVTYPGIGVIVREIDGRQFAADVYHAGSGARAGVREGDEILTVDGAPWSEIGSFEGRTGESVILQIRREAMAEPFGIEVPVEAIRPNEMFTASIAESISVSGHEGRKVGYIRLWSFTSTETMSLLRKELTEGRLAQADGIVLDLRSRWGGAPLDLGEVFLGGTPAVDMIDRDGKPVAAQVRWRKPIVAIIDEGTRSGLELFAHALKLNGVPLVGSHTARAVVTGSPFILPDDSLLQLPVLDIEVDGVRIEETGVTPDIEVPRDIRFENGADPQTEAAIEALQQLL